MLASLPLLALVVEHFTGAQWWISIAFFALASVAGSALAFVTALRDLILERTVSVNFAEEFLAGYELTQAQLARALGISPNRIAEIVHNRRRISADTALRLGLFFGTTPEFWMNLQTHYDLKLARRALGPETAERIAAQRVA